MKYLVTGGAGFIGSSYAKMVLRDGHEVFVVDALTYAGDEQRLAEQGLRIRNARMDVNDPEFPDLLKDYQPDVLVHFAAETHVTRSETDPHTFFRANVSGTRSVLESAERAHVPLTIHVSTDEVYGPCEGQPFREEQKEPGEGKATSAYARSKALADDIAVDLATRTPLSVVRLTNCFGPWQHPEKAMARWIIRALNDEPLPVWGDGNQVRDWMHVSDACEAIRVVENRGVPGQVYNVAPESGQVANLTIAHKIATAAGRSPESVYTTEYDRPNHDRRYAIDSSRLRSLGWEPARSFEEGLAETVEWYADNRSWWNNKVSGAEALYDDERARA